MSSLEVLHHGKMVTKATKALILLHGRGGTAQGILNLADHFCDPDFYIAVPQAPNNTWYPYSFLVEEARNEPFLSASVEGVYRIIEETVAHIPKEKIYIMGFSQGACLALEISARHAYKYGGVVAFTGGLIGSTINENKYYGNFEGTKVFIGNSDTDPHVPLSRSEQSRDLMTKLGAQVTLKVYKGMGHTINQDEIAWVKNNIFA